jgi:hypothetical protein
LEKKIRNQRKNTNRELQRGNKITMKCQEREKERERERN